MSIQILFARFFYVLYFQDILRKTSILGFWPEAQPSFEKLHGANPRPYHAARFHGKRASIIGIPSLAPMPR